MRSILGPAGCLLLQSSSLHLFCSGCISNNCVAACGQGWEGKGDHCYFWSTIKKNWAAAEHFCQKEGGHLTSVTSDAINNFVLEGMERKGVDNAWIGGSDMEEKGIWKWAESSSSPAHCYPWQVEFWAEGEPNNIGVEQCVHIVLNQVGLSSAETSKWNNWRCNKKLGFVCSKKICPGSEEPTDSSDPNATSEPDGASETDTSCERKECVVEAKTDYNGMDIKWKIKESQQACADYCSSTDGCCFWSWNGNKECYVKTGIGRKSKNPRGVSGNRACGKTSSEQPPVSSEPNAPSEPNGPSETDTSCEPKECVINEKTDYNGDDIKEHKITETQQACAERCASTEGCCFWTWNKHKECFVKRSKGQQKGNKGAVSGNRACGKKPSEEPREPSNPNAPSEPNGPSESDTSCEPKECVVEKKTDYNGMDIKWKIKESQQACADWCALTDGCCYWSWNGNKECYVKTGIGKKSKNPRGVSGNRACGKKPSEQG